MLRDRVTVSALWAAETVRGRPGSAREEKSSLGLFALVCTHGRPFPRKVAFGFPLTVSAAHNAETVTRSLSIPNLCQRALRRPQRTRIGPQVDSQVRRRCSHRLPVAPTSAAIAR